MYVGTFWTQQWDEKSENIRKAYWKIEEREQRKQRGRRGRNEVGIKERKEKTGAGRKEEKKGRHSGMEARRK